MFLRVKLAKKSWSPYSLLVIGVIGLLFLSACGEGSIEINKKNALESEVNIKNSGVKKNINSEEARIFFEENLWPLMKESSGAGCASATCHKLTDDPHTFFSVDSESAENSWNWAKVRRFELESGDYLDPKAIKTPRLIKDQMEDNHFNFNAWTADQKALVTTWFEIE